MSGKADQVLANDARKHDLLVGIFVIDAEQGTASLVIEREEGDIVVVVAELLELSGGALLQRIEGRRVGEEWVAPSKQDIGAVALGDVMGLVNAGLDLIEVEAIRGADGAGRALAQQRRPEQRRRGNNAERAAHHCAAAIASQDDVADRLALWRAERHIVVGLIGFGPVAEAVGFRHMLSRKMFCGDPSGGR